jgi:hypothetical protein
VRHRTITVTVSILAVAMLISGCGSSTDHPTRAADNSAEVCATFWAMIDNHNAPDDPAGAALDKALEANPGHADASAVASAKAVWFQEVADDLHAVAGTASKPALKSALTRAADSFDRNAAGPVPVPEQSVDPYTGLEPVVTLCPQPDAEPSVDGT